jgi:glycosyltransferase involved in cell wall biosynthesis
MLTVVLATRDRAGPLGRVLDRFAALQSPAGGWKLVVVDNGSTDDTPAVLAGFADRLPLQVVREPRSGMNAALNAALGSLSGDLMVKADDDVLPSPDWLVQYRKAADAHPECSVFGGTVEPAWPSALPAWLSERAANFGILYAQCRHPAGACRLADIYGPNWALRSAVFASGMHFDERIGPDSARKLYPMGGETELFARLETQGHRGWFVPEAAVRHIVRPDQLTEDWILHRAYLSGFGNGHVRPPRCATGPLLAGVPQGVLIRLCVYRVLATLAWPLPRSSRRLRLQFQDRWFTGLAHAFRQSSAERRLERQHAIIFGGDIRSSRGPADAA